MKYEGELIEIRQYYISKTVIQLVVAIIAVILSLCFPIYITSCLNIFIGAEIILYLLKAFALLAYLDFLEQRKEK